MNYKDKVIWITGASSGIGEALVYAFLQRGAKIILSSENEKELNRVKETAKFTDEQAIILPFDLSNVGDADALVEKAVAKFGRIDYVINNGGISQRAMIKEVPVEVERKVMEINFFGTITFTKAVLKQMLKQQSGHIAVTSSIVGKFGFPLRSAYSASKHALQGYFETLRAESVPDNIFVSIIIPGRVQTNISKYALKKDGEFHGKLDAGQASGITSDKAAEIIIKGLSKRKKEILVGATELMMVHIRRFLPRVYYKMVTKIKPM